MTASLPSKAKAGEEVKVTLTFASNYATDQTRIHVSSSSSVSFSYEKNVISFQMPQGDVTIEVSSYPMSASLSISVDSGLSLVPYVKKTMKEAYDESKENVSGLYQGKLSEEAVGSYAISSTFRFVLRGDGYLRISEISGEEETHIAEGGYEANPDSDGVIHILFSNVKGSNGYVYEGEFLFQEGSQTSGTLLKVSSLHVRSGSYDATYVSGTLDQIQKAPDYDPDAMVYLPLGTVPESLAHDETIYFVVEESDDAVLSSFLVNEVEAVPEEQDGVKYYPVPYAEDGTKVHVVAADRLAPIKIQGNSLLTVTSFVKDQTGAYVQADQAKHHQEVYFKAEAPADGSASLRELTLQYDVKGNKAYLSKKGLTLNADGYYEGDKSKMEDMSYGLVLTVLEKSSFQSDASLVGNASLFNVGSSTSNASVTLTAEGDVTCAFSSYSMNYYYEPSDVSGNKISLHLLGSTNFNSELYFDGAGHFLIRALGGLDLSNYFYFSLSSKETSMSLLLNGVSASQSSVAYGKLGEEETYLDLKNRLFYPSISSDNLSLDSVFEEGCAFDLKQGDALIATYMNKKGKLVSYVRGYEGTFSGPLGDLVSNPSKISLSGKEASAFAFSSSQSGLLDLVYAKEDGLYFSELLLDESSMSYASVPNKPYDVKISEDYCGGTLSDEFPSAPRIGWYTYRIRFSGKSQDSSLPSPFMARIRSGGDYEEATLLGDGKISFESESHDFTAAFSSDGNSIFATSPETDSLSEMDLLVSKSILPGSSTGGDASLLTVKVGNSFLTELSPKASSNGSRSNDVLLYENKGKGHFVSISYPDGENSTYENKGTRFSYDGSSLQMNVGGEGVEDFSGTYLTSNGNLVISGKNVTYSGFTSEWTYLGDDKISFVHQVTSEDGTTSSVTYSATLDVEAKKASVGQNR